ncbi:DNA helicase UvrB [Loigolactobacillus binensis]|uniref:DNA helicase UvrB n=1 Tax=Loigolactobacillus binensis TaxID=2559922 RepID=A0ABW3EBU1_9LACO|nr:DNA helicase UvrB [Loigolactobacillus binensis]
MVNLPIGTKDAVLAIALMVILVITIIFKQSWIEFVIEELMLGLAFFGGSLKRDKRLR